MDEATAALRAIYLGLVAEVDHHLGRLLAWLDATDQTEPTLVIVTADHGEMPGDQGMWGKESVFRPAHHIPLIIRDPERLAPGAEIRAITETVDIAPTVLHWLGASVPHAMDGASLPGLAQGVPAGWRNAALTEIDLASPVAPTRFQRAWGLDANGCNAAVLRDARWTTVHFNGGLPPMLFDRETDPAEREDLARNRSAEPLIRQLMGAMLDRRMTRADRRLTHLSFGV